MRQPSALASALLVTPSRLPVPMRSGRSRLLVGVRHNWVLHRRVLVRVLAGLACAIVVVALFQARGGMSGAAQSVADVFSGRSAAAGFGITAIEIKGLSVATERDIALQLGANPHSSIFAFDPEAARARIETLPAVQTANVRKVYPNGLVVEVTEVAPVARWWSEGETYLIDAAGTRLGQAAEVDAGLPLVIGEGAGDDALPLIRAISRFPELQNDLVAYSRVADRRWDLVYSSGMKVQLPETGVAASLQALDELNSAHQLLDRDLSLIDLRVEGLAALRVTVREAEQTPKRENRR